MVVIDYKKELRIFRSELRKMEKAIVNYYGDHNTFVPAINALLHRKNGEYRQSDIEWIEEYRGW